MSPRIIRIGAPYYLCVRPLLFGLTRSPEKNVELLYNESASLSSQLESGDLDAALIPSIEFLSGVGASFIKGPSLVARAKKGSLLLVSKVPLEELGRIAVDEYCRTPIAALRITLDTLHHMLPDICVAKNVENSWQEQYDAILLSGDRALHYLYHGPQETLHAFDISEMWHTLTSKPLVLFMWVYNDSTLESHLNKILVSSRNLGIKNLSLLSDGVAQTTPYNSEYLYQYFNESWSYQLGYAEIDGLKVLEDYALRYRLIREKKLTHISLVPGE